ETIPGSALEACYLRGPFTQLEMVTVREGLGELFLMGNEQDATQLPPEVLQLLDHHLTTFAVQAAEPLVDDDRLDGPMLAAGVLTDPQRQTHGDPEALAAAQKRDADRGLSRRAVVGFQLQRLVGLKPVLVLAQPQVQLASRQTVQDRVGVGEDAAF